MSHQSRRSSTHYNVTRAVGDRCAASGESDAQPTGLVRGSVGCATGDYGCTAMFNVVAAPTLVMVAVPIDVPPSHWLVYPAVLGCK